MLWLLLACLSAFAADVECPQRTRISDLSVMMDLALDSYEGELWQVFEAAARDSEKSMACLITQLGAREASDYHLIQGLKYVVAGSQEEARPFLITSYRLFPEKERRDQIIQADGSIADMLQGAEPQALPLGVVPPPLRGTIVIDGQAARRFPLTAPYLLQRVQRRQGMVLESRLVEAGRAPHGYPKARRTLLAVAGVGALLSGAAFGTAAMQRRMAVRCQPDAESAAANCDREWGNMKNWNHRLIGAGIGLGAIATGSSVLLVVSYR